MSTVTIEGVNRSNPDCFTSAAVLAVVLNHAVETFKFKTADGLTFEGAQGEGKVPTLLVLILSPIKVMFPLNKLLLKVGAVGVVVKVRGMEAMLAPKL